jgi:pimeloyl-ACP methyl ester carboxylesterase
MQKEATQQGIYESLLRDQVAMFGRWEFDPSELKNPFENGEGSVHIWHGDEDFLVPLMLQQYVTRKLPWIHLHVVPGAGHLLVGVPDLPAQILKTLLKENVDYHSLA